MRGEDEGGKVVVEDGGGGIRVGSSVKVPGGNLVVVPEVVSVTGGGGGGAEVVVTSASLVEVAREDVAAGGNGASPDKVGWAMVVIGEVVIKEVEGAGGDVDRPVKLEEAVEVLVLLVVEVVLMDVVVSEVKAMIR